MERGARDRDCALAAGGASLAFFVLYAYRLCPTLCLSGDSAELVTAAALWGVPHAPGYPLFTAIGHAFTWLPLGDVALRVHLTSAVFHAGAVGATVLAAFAVTKNRIAALAAGCALGLERSFLLGSLYAEVFPLNDLLFASLLALALRLRANAQPDRGASPLPFVLVAGIAAAHHMMIALAAPALAVLTLRPLAAHFKEPRRALVLLVAFAAPIVLAYSLIPLAAARDPALSWGDVHDPRSFLSLVTRRDYGGLFSSVHGGGHGTGFERVAALAGLLATGFGGVTLALAAIGAADLVRRQTAIGVSLVLAALVSGPLFASLNALDTRSDVTLAFFERFATMCTVPIAVAFGAGVAAAMALYSAASRTARVARVAGAFALGAWAVASCLRVRDVDMRHDDRGIVFAHDLLLDSPDRSLLLLSGDAPANAALYVCAVEHLCGDRVALSPGTLFMPWAMAQTRRRHPDLDIPWHGGPAMKRTHDLAAAEAPKRPVFVYPDLFEKDAALAEVFTPLPDHLLFRLWPRGTDVSVERDAFLASARAITSGEGLSGVGSPAGPQPQLALAYQAAAFNHARAALGIPEARDLVPALLARAGDYARSSDR